MVMRTHEPGWYQQVSIWSTFLTRIAGPWPRAADRRGKGARSEVSPKRGHLRILGYNVCVSPDPLPIDEISGPLLRALRSTQAVAVEAPAGSGAALSIGSALLEAGWGAEREIWVAVSRPVAAQLAAEQVARQLGQSP